MAAKFTVTLLSFVLLMPLKRDAAFTFDYLCLLAVSSTIAAIGLATNSMVAIVASSKFAEV